MSETDFLSKRWQASPNLLVGGWSVQPEDEKPIHEGGVALGDFMTEELAKHVVQVHNSSLGSHTLEVALRRLLVQHQVECEFRPSYQEGEMTIMPDLSDIYTATIKQILALTSGEVSPQDYLDKLAD